jgi:elongation factor Ts
MVKELREKSGAPMMDCKKALSSPDVDGDMTKAMDWLRAKGIARAASGADRVSTEGVIAAHVDTSTNGLCLLEINSETDFVSRNADFQKFANTVITTASNVLPTGSLDMDTLTQSPVDGGSTVVKDSLGDVINIIRENIVLRRGLKMIPAENEIFSTYIHGKVGMDALPSHIQMGTCAGVVKITSENAADDVKEKIAEAGKKLAMHIVAAKPQYLDRSAVPQDVVDREVAISK